MQENNIELSLVLPCWNEGKILLRNLTHISNILNHLNCTYEIIVVDDNSSDETRKTVEDFFNENPEIPNKRIYHQASVGQCKSVIDGVRASSGKIIGIIEADLGVHARYIPAFILAVRQGADVAIARRYYRVSLLTLHRYFLNVGYRFIARSLLKVKIHDMEAGFKFFKKEKLAEVLDLCRCHQWFWNTEVITWSWIKGFCITEIPCLYVRTPGRGLSFKPLSSSFIYFVNLWRLKRIICQNNIQEKKTKGD